VNLAQMLHKHQIRHQDLALISGRTTRAVTQWVHGVRPIPRSLELVLLALDDGRIDEKWLAQKLAPKLRKAKK
jgi:hypothetical protein